VRALAVLIALAVVGAGCGDDESDSPTTQATVSSTPTAPDTTPTAPPPPAPEPEPQPEPTADPERAAIELAVSRFIEGAQNDPETLGLPTTDELSIEAVNVRGDRARVRLAGGARLFLTREGGDWRVTRVKPGRVIPPSGPTNE
jgi:hypothetical protein